MKVCMVSKHFLPYAGGLEVRVRELSRWLAKKGESVLVLTSHEDGTRSREIIDGVEVKRSHVIFNVFNALFAPGVFLDLMRSDYDVIDVNLPDPVNSVFAFFVSLAKGKPLHVTYHADIIRDGLLYMPFKLLYAPLQWLVLIRARKIFVTSPNYAGSSPSLRGFMDKVVVAPSFVDPKRYNTSVDGMKVREKHKVGKKKMVLFVGRLVGYKGVEYLIRACGGIDDLVLVIVGDGELRGSLEGMVREKGFGNVVFAGQITDEELPSYYAACDLFVLPSVTRQEAFGLVLVEAMACGKPVVSTDFSGMPYVVGDAGLLVGPRDDSALREAILKIARDRPLSQKLGKKAVERVEKLFTKDVVCVVIWNVYKSSVVKV